MQRSRSGFTLLETVISLAIFCTLAAVSIYNLKDYQAKVEERQAISWFKNTFTETLNYGYLNKRAAKFQWFTDSNTIKFISNGSLAGQQKYYKKKKLPATLRINSNAAIDYGIADSGVAPPMSIQFHSTLTNKDYSYKVQFGWGEIIEQ
nr:type II secretion system protein [Companilactobacillus kimchiensis]